MIEVLIAPDGSGTQLRLRPPRALDARQFFLLFAVLAGVMWLAAGLGWFTGNVFAPVFALLYSVLLAVALRTVWRSGERQEEIRVVPACVEVIPAPGHSPVFSAHPHWVRLIADERRVRLASSGRQVDVGSFLAPAERQVLAQKLEGLLAATDGRNRRR